MSSELQIVTVERGESESVDETKVKSKKQEEDLKECQKLLGTKVNTENFIYAIEQQPAIWDASSEAYSNKQVKLNAWSEIICTFLPDFEQQSLADRNNLMTLMQKKWKSIRSCYTRELLRLKGVKSGSAATRKKQYTYFEQLRFLETAVKKTTTNLDEEDIVNEEANETAISCDSGPIFSNSQNKSKKRTSNDNELIEVLENKIALEEKYCTFDETDKDKLFLLSLLTEIHKVPAEKKLKLRADMLSLVAAAQTPVQQEWQQGGYTGPSIPMPSPSVQLQPMQQCPMEQQHMQRQTISQPGLVNQQPQVHFSRTKFQELQEANIPVLSPPSADISVTNEESEIRMTDSLLFNI